MNNYTEKQLNGLWGGFITDYKFDIKNHTIWLHVQIMEEDDVRSYDVNMEGVTEFCLKDLQEYKWEEIELTSIEAKTTVQNAKSKIEVRIELWASEFLVICKTLRVLPVKDD